MKHFSKVLFALFFAASYLFYACEPEEMVGDSSNSANDFTVRAKNGYLEFKDTTALNEVMTLLKDKDQEALDAWENQFPGFTSLRSIDEQAIAAQEQWFEELRNMTAEERALLKAGDEDFWYSDFMKDHASSFILEDSGMYKLNTTGLGHEMMSFINGEGIFKLGGEIYMYKRNTIKIIHDGDDSKISLLSTMTESNDDLKISVHNDIMQPLMRNNSNARQEYNINMGNGIRCGHVNDKDRVTGESYVEWVPVSGTGFWFATVYIRAENWYKDGIFGGYTRKPTGYLKIEGNINWYVDGQFHYGGNLYMDTGGSLKSQIYGYIYEGPYQPARNYAVSSNGNVTVYGRNSTKCGDGSDIATNNQWALR